MDYKKLHLTHNLSLILMVDGLLHQNTIPLRYRCVTILLKMSSPTKSINVRL